MPLFLRVWLRALSTAAAQQLWDYLDGNPVAHNDMIEFIVDSHKSLQAKTITKKRNHS